MTPTHGTDILSAALATLGEWSGRGETLTLDALLDLLADRGFPVGESGTPERIQAGFTAAGVASFVGIDGATRWHDRSLLSGTYARILDRKADPVRLMAEEIRRNSRLYPRTLPVECFEAPPFDLSPEVIEGALKTMAGDPAYADVACLFTDRGAAHLYSTQSLDHRYARFLAERMHTLAENP